MILECFEEKMIDIRGIALEGRINESKSKQGEIEKSLDLEYETFGKAYLNESYGF